MRKSSSNGERYFLKVMFRENINRGKSEEALYIQIRNREAQQKQQQPPEN